MANIFLHDESGIASIITEVRNSIDIYNENIEKLSTLIETMKSSNAWVDEDVKSSFINTAIAYITSYKSFSAGLIGYMNCLEKKSENIVTNESSFS